MTRAADFRAADWQAALGALLPRGRAWPKRDSVQAAFMAGLADRLQAFHARVLTLLEDESDPARTTELLADWERAVGLPDDCSPNTSFSRASLATYVDAAGVLRFARVDQPRYVYDAAGPTNTLILEAAATNLFGPTRAITLGGAWGLGSNAIDLGAVTGPDGSMMARRIGASAIGGDYLTRSSLAVTPGSTLGFSAWLRCNAGTLSAGSALLVDEYSGTTFLRRNAGLSLATLGLGTAWKWVSRTLTIGADADHVTVIPVADSPAGVEIEVDWPQLEAGAPSSTIVLDGITATRAADHYAAKSIADRRAALLSRLAAQGGQSRAYFIAVAAALGYPIAVTEFRPARAGVLVAGGPCLGPDWIFTWQVNAAATALRAAAAGSLAAGDPLRVWGNGPLECVLGKLKPARSALLFAYS